VTQRRRRLHTNQTEFDFHALARVRIPEAPGTQRSASDAPLLRRAECERCRAQNALARERLALITATMLVCIGEPLLILAAQCLHVDVKPVQDTFGIALATVAPILSTSAAYYFARRNAQCHCG
jgi:hypothetical protein